MQFLTEINSSDGNATAKLFDDGGNIITELWLANTLQKVVMIEGQSLDDAKRAASAWVGSIQTLNG